MTTPNPNAAARLDRVAPGLFVILWSTGWIVAHVARDRPFAFLSWRYGLALLVLVPVALVTRAQWPRERAAIGHALVSGVLLHALYLGGVWWAIAHGVESSVSALIAAIQPITTALLAPTLAGERVERRQWIGLAAGCVGLVLVLAPKLAGVDPATLSATVAPLIVNAGAMVAVTLGSFYQRRFLAHGDLTAITALQYAAALVVTLPVAALLGPLTPAWDGAQVLAMIWAVGGLSIGAIMLMLVLIRRGTVSRTAQLIFLVPPAAALQSWWLFGETLTALQLVGMAVTAAGVLLATRRPG